MATDMDDKHPVRTELTKEADNNQANGYNACLLDDKHPVRTKLTKEADNNQANGYKPWMINIR